MIFVVNLLGRTASNTNPTVLNSVEFEADDLFSVVDRTRIILSSNSFEPAVDAFQILVEGRRIIYQECRDSAEPYASDSSSNSATSEMLQRG